MQATPARQVGDPVKDISISKIKSLTMCSALSINVLKLMRQAYECRTQQEIVLIKHSDIYYIMPSGSPAIVNRRKSNKYLFIKIISLNEPITQHMRNCA